MYAQLAAILAPVFLTSATGFVWGKARMPFDLDMTARLIANVAVPFLVFSTLSKLAIDPSALLRSGALAGLSLLAFAAASAAMLAAFGLPVRSYLGPLAFPNVGNMGLSICYFAYGEAGLPYAIAYFIVCSVAQMVFVPILAMEGAKLGALARLPILYGLAAGVGGMFLGVTPPKWLADTAALIGGLTIPLMLVAQGVSLARIETRAFGRSFALAAFRLGSGAGGGFALAWTFGLAGVERGVFVIQCSMPVAVLSYIFAARYDRDPDGVAGMILVSTAMGFVVAPALLAILMH